MAETAEGGCAVSKKLLIAVLLLLGVSAYPGVAAAQQQQEPTVTPLAALPIVFHVGVAGDLAGLGGSAGGVLVSGPTFPGPLFSDGQGRPVASLVEDAGGRWTLTYSGGSPNAWADAAALEQLRLVVEYDDHVDTRAIRPRRFRRGPRRAESDGCAACAGRRAGLAATRGRGRDADVRVAQVPAAPSGTGSIGRAAGRARQLRRVAVRDDAGRPGHGPGAHHRAGVRRLHADGPGDTVGRHAGRHRADSDAVGLDLLGVRLDHRGQHRRGQRGGRGVLLEDVGGPDGSLSGRGQW